MLLMAGTTNFSRYLIKNYPSTLGPESVGTPQYLKYYRRGTKTFKLKCNFTNKILNLGKRGNPNSMLLMPGKRFGNPNSMLLMPAGKRDLLLPRPNGLILGKRNPNSVFLGPLYRRAEEKRETDLDEFFTSRGKKSVLYVPVGKLAIFSK